MADFKFDASRFQAASAKLRAFARKKAPEEAARLHMKQFVVKVIDLTAPSKGKANREARSRGERAIDIDTSVTMDAVPEDKLAVARDFYGGTTFAAQQFRNKEGVVYLEDLNHIMFSVEEALRFHNEKRSKSTGRPSNFSKNGRVYYGTRRREGVIGRHKADDIALVPPRVLEQVRKQLYKRVGELAAGWNKAVRALGGKAPAWIARHGDRHGSVVITATPESFRITIINSVPFVDNIRGLDRRIQSALDATARDLERGFDAALRRATRAAGFR